MGGKHFKKNSEYGGHEGKEHGTVSKLNGVEGEQGRMRVDGVGLVWVPENQIWRQGLGSGCLIRR